MLLTKRLTILDDLTEYNYNDIIKKYVDDRFKNLLEEYKPAIFELVRNTASMPITYFIKFIKQNVFKGEVSQLSLGFWINRGYSLDEAKMIISKEQRERSNLCKEYWIKKGCSEEEADCEISKVQKYNSHLSNNVSIEELRQRSVRCKEHWLKKGYSEEEASTQVRKVQTTTTLEHFINLYGIEDGKERFKACGKKKSRFGKDNHQFGKPAPKGSGRGISGYYKDYYFRSLYEYKIIKKFLENDIVFYCNDKAGNKCTEHEKIVIPYIFEGKKRNYIPDFIAIYNDKKYIIEVKNKYSVTTEETKEKLAALDIFVKSSKDFACVIVIDDVKVDVDELGHDYNENLLAIDAGKLQRFLKRIGK